MTHSPACVTATEVRLTCDEGAVWAGHSAAGYATWEPLAAALGEVHVVGRADVAARGPVRVDGPGVSVYAVPNYQGLAGLIRTMPKVWASLSRLGTSETVFLGRLPEPLSVLLYLRSRRLGAPFVSMVVSEPDQLLRAHFGGWRGRLAGRIARLLARWIVRRSAGAIYVSQSWLQHLYPTVEGTPTLARSNVHLPSEAFSSRADTVVQRDGGPVRLISIGSLTGWVKGADVLLRLVGQLRDMGIEVSMKVIGDGHDRLAAQQMAADLGLAQSVEFLGHVSSVEDVRVLLDEADIYISASRAEGLPRASVEAMARSLPVVTTKAGAAEELVDAEWLVPIDDVTGLAAATAKLASDEKLRGRVGATNQARARKIQETATKERLTNFLGGFNARR